MKSLDSIPFYEANAEKLLKSDVKNYALREWSPLFEGMGRPLRVLDLGCGSGLELRAMREAGLEASGLEGSASRARIAREHNPQAHILEKNLLFYQPKEAEWDAVWANRVLHHFTPEETQRVIAVLARGIRPQGRLGVVVYEGSAPFLQAGDEITGPGRSLHPWQEHPLSSLIEQSGFSILKVGRQGPDPERGHALPSLLFLAERVGVKQEGP